MTSSCVGAGDCLGGNRDQALSYIKNTGSVEEVCFPYTSGACTQSKKDGKKGLDCTSSCSCSGDRCSDPCSCSGITSGCNRWDISGYNSVGSSVNDIKSALLCHGPLSVCSDNWWHCVTIVGWDDASTAVVGYTGTWIIKNSWGTGYSSGAESGGYGEIPYSGHEYSDLRNEAKRVNGVGLK